MILLKYYLLTILIGITNCNIVFSIKYSFPIGAQRRIILILRNSGMLYTVHSLVIYYSCYNCIILHQFSILIVFCVWFIIIYEDVILASYPVNYMNYHPFPLRKKCKQFWREISYSRFISPLSKIQYFVRMLFRVFFISHSVHRGEHIWICSKV